MPATGCASPRASWTSSTVRAVLQVTLAKLHESDAAMAAAEELANSALPPAPAYDEAERLRQAIADAEEARDRDVAGLADLEHRLELAAEAMDEMEPDHAERDRLAEQARLAEVQRWMLGSRCGPWRSGRALAGRADALRRAAEGERQARL